jgi:hypothetical protein
MTFSREEADSMAVHRWCPECWDRFPLYFRVCPDCQVALTDQRLGPAPTPNQEIVRVFVATDEALVGITRSLLEGESIEYLERFERLQDLFGWGRFGTGYNYVVGPVEFWVCADEADHARACLEGLENPVPEDIILPDDDTYQQPPANSK